MQGMLAQARRVLFHFDLLHTADDFDFGAVVEIASFSTLEPDHFAIIFCHVNIFLSNLKQVAESNKTQGINSLGFKLQINHSLRQNLGHNT